MALYFGERRVKLNHKTRCPGNLAFVDTETTAEAVKGHPNKQRHVLHLGVARAVRIEDGRYMRRAEIVFTDQEAFWNWIESRLCPSKPLWLFAHSAGFDATILGTFRQIERRRFMAHCDPSPNDSPPEDVNWERSPGCFVMEDPPTIIQLRHVATGARLWICDSMNWYKCSLAKLGQSMRMPKLERPAIGVETDELVCYCRRDCEIVESAILHLIGMIREHDLGTFAPTAAGQAMNAYRHRFMKSTILPHDCKTAKEVERACYHGGETRLWRVGKIDGMVYQLDVNSLYPTVMMNKAYPSQLIQVREEATTADVIRLPPSIGCCALVEIDSPSVPYPVKRDGKLLFACGRFTTGLCGDELISACHYGHVRRLSNLQLYNLHYLFRDWVGEMYALRQKCRESGNRASADLVKILLNSLYGKWGQWGRRFLPLFSYPAAKPWGYQHEWLGPEKRVRKLQFIAGQTFECVDRVERRGSFPIISAYITMHGRRYMGALRAAVGEQNVIYQATDSLHVTGEGMRLAVDANLVSETELGLLKLEDVAARAAYWGINRYDHDGKRVDAGLKPSAELGSDGLWHEDHFSRLKDTLSAQPDGAIIVTRVRKAESKHDVRGRVAADGSVSPLILGVNDA